MTFCNSWQYLGTILAKNFARSWKDLAKISLRYRWRVNMCRNLVSIHGFLSMFDSHLGCTDLKVEKNIVIVPTVVYNLFIIIITLL